MNSGGKPRSCAETEGFRPMQTPRARLWSALPTHEVPAVGPEAEAGERHWPRRGARTRNGDQATTSQSLAGGGPDRPRRLSGRVWRPGRGEGGREAASPHEAPEGCGPTQAAADDPPQPRRGHEEG